MKVLLYSGGMDSWLIDKIWHPDKKIFFNTGIEYNKEELKRLPEDVEIIKLDLSKYELAEYSHTVPLRNLLFISIASYYGDEICLGSVKGDCHFDNSLEFLNNTEKLLNSLYEELDVLGQGHKELKIVAPYKEWSKADLLKEYVANGGTLEEAYNVTFSCYEPIDGHECLHCKPCFKKTIAFINAGMEIKNKEAYIELLKENAKKFHLEDDEEYLQAISRLNGEDNER